MRPLTTCAGKFVTLTPSTVKHMRLTFFLFFITCTFIAKAQVAIPVNAISPEDEVFNAMYNQAPPPVITGKLLNVLAGDLDTLPVSFTLLTPFAEAQQKKIVTVKPDGSFSITLDHALPYQQIWFGVGELFYACLYANKGLHLELDMQKIKAAKEVNFNGDGVRYLGEDGPLNTYCNNYILYKRPEQLELSGKIYGMNRSSAHVADSLLPAFNKLFDSLKNIEGEYIAANPSPYGWLLQNERMSNYYGLICIMYWGKMMDDSIWRQLTLHKPYAVSNSSAEYYRYLFTYIRTRPDNYQQVTWKDVALLPNLTEGEKAIIDSLNKSEKMNGQYPYTKSNIDEWVKLLKKRMQTCSLTKNLAKNIKTLDSMFLPGKADLLKFQLNESHDVAEQKLALGQILVSMHAPWCKSMANSEYQHALTKMNDINRSLAAAKSGTALASFGKPLLQTSFGASLYKAPSVKALDFLVKLKQSFPGKAIIIDRWATWCAPCLAEMPHSKALEESSKDLPVVFVYLCTLNGSTEDKWKSKVAELKQPGVHFLIDEGLDNAISSYFSFSGYPGHAFIDKNGKYKPGAFKGFAEIQDAKALANLVNN